MKAILIILVAVLAVDAFGKYENRFMDYGVYVIENRAHPAVLTFVNATDDNGVVRMAPPKIFELDVNSSAQRWRLDQSAFYTAFELRSVINENYVLEYIPEGRVLRFFSHFGNTKLWYLQDSGDGYTMVKHKRYDICLEAIENHGDVIARECKGTIFQQWLFKPTVLKSS